MRHLKWILGVGLILSCWFSPSLPLEWGWKNGPLEWLQVAVLASGLLLSALWAYQARHSQNGIGYRLWLWAIMGWALLIGRELSWGRVFFITGVNEKGPILMRLSELRFGYLVHPMFALIVILWLLAGYRHEIYRHIYMLLTCPSFPFGDVGMAMIACVIGYIGEKYLYLPVVEELAENIVYLESVVIATRVRLLLNSQQCNSATERCLK